MADSDMATRVPEDPRHVLHTENLRQVDSVWQATARCSCRWGSIQTAADPVSLERRIEAASTQHVEFSRQWSKSLDRFPDAPRPPGERTEGSPSGGAFRLSLLAAFVLLAVVGFILVVGGSDDPGSDEEEDPINYSEQCGTLLALANDEDQLTTTRADALDKYAEYC